MHINTERPSVSPSYQNALEPASTPAMLDQHDMALPLNTVPHSVIPVLPEPIHVQLRRDDYRDIFEPETIQSAIIIGICCGIFGPIGGLIGNWIGPDGIGKFVGSVCGLIVGWASGISVSNWLDQ